MIYVDISSSRWLRKHPDSTAQPAQLLDLTNNQQKENRQLRLEISQLNTEYPSDEKGSFYGR